MLRRMQAYVIYTDLFAAFDKLNYAIAVAKLDRYRKFIVLVPLIYLTDRKLMVNLDDWIVSKQYPAYRKEAIWGH